MLKTLFIWDALAVSLVFLLKGIEMDFLSGILIGTITICFNFRILKVVINSISVTGQKTYMIIIAMLLHAARFLIFLLTIYISVKISFLCAVGYGVSVIGFTLAIVITNLRGDENDKCR